MSLNNQNCFFDDFSIIKIKFVYFNENRILDKVYFNKNPDVFPGCNKRRNKKDLLIE